MLEPHTKCNVLKQWTLLDIKVKDCKGLFQNTEQKKAYLFRNLLKEEEAYVHVYPFIYSSEAPTMSYKSGSVLRIFFFKLAGFNHPVLCYLIFCTSSTIIKLCSPPFLQPQLLCAKRQTPYLGLMAHLNAPPMITKTSCINCPGLHISIIII